MDRYFLQIDCKRWESPRPLIPQGTEAVKFLKCTRWLWKLTCDWEQCSHSVTSWFSITKFIKLIRIYNYRLISDSVGVRFLIQYTVQQLILSTCAYLITLLSLFLSFDPLCPHEMPENTQCKFIAQTFTFCDTNVVNDLEPIYKLHE